MKHPFLIALGAGAVVLLAAFLPALLQALRGGPPLPASSTVDAAPWQARAVPGGAVAAMGFTLPGSRLADAQARWPEELQVAVMAPRGEPGALEAYLESYREGGFAGRLVIVAEAAPETLSRWQARAARAEPVDGRTVRYTLQADDRAEALSAPLAGLTFIPGAQLDAATLQQRFGAPAERWASGERIEQWLYPDRGLAVALDAEGREVLQFVAPAEFERRLRAPLQASGARRLP